MAMNDDKFDGDLQRDPKLARLLETAGREEPPAVLDAAILAAARREVGARPQVVGGGGDVSAPPVRAGHVKRNWYVPMSIAAVLVLSVSLVRLMHEEKGDDLAQPPAASRPLPKAPPPTAAEPAAASPEKADAMLRDAMPSKPKLAEEKRTAPPKAADTQTAPEAYAEPAKKQRAEKTEVAADSVAADSVAAMGSARRDQSPGAVPRELGSVSGAAAAKAPGAAGGMASGVPAPAPVQRAEPFPAARERESAALATVPATPAPTAAPPQPTREAMEARPRSEADRNLTRGAIMSTPAAPEGKVLAAPRRAGPADDTPAQSEGRPMAPPPPPAATAAPPAPKSVVRLAQQRAPLWRGLEDQPPEKWLERLAEYRRDNRQADADELLAEFRLRFPDHPAGTR